MGHGHGVLGWGTMGDIGGCYSGRSTMVQTGCRVCYQLALDSKFAPSC